MTKKQFAKKLMSRGLSARQARDLIDYMRELRRGIENHENMVVLANSKPCTFVPAKVYSYEETFQRMMDGREIFS